MLLNIKSPANTVVLVKKWRVKLECLNKIH